MNRFYRNFYGFLFGVILAFAVTGVFAQETPEEIHGLNFPTFEVCFKRGLDGYGRLLTGLEITPTEAGVNLVKTLAGYACSPAFSGSLGEYHARLKELGAFAPKGPEVKF